ncbi:hypothetical protein A6V39_05405 [Candidatus Mycoplasma haematobovis]|uniref:Uncharacterized protein n=1 Tax=Candidatus Mycoplasma haematobovis TaxID=432608 RepID=A0A1A9QB41_9MOLU|nr:hypothetical protein [Candidatus Mycoplasma haematobovis]OAL09772.1 hypothetical protein A6V39_05405 [Candidatus Mycoplasma haematobovis]
MTKIARYKNEWFINSEAKEAFLKNFPNALALKDHCYKKAEEDKELKECEIYDCRCEKCMIKVK